MSVWSGSIGIGMAARNRPVPSTHTDPSFAFADRAAAPETPLKPWNVTDGTGEIHPVGAEGESVPSDHLWP